jgi:hypothetical protein
MFIAPNVSKPEKTTADQQDQDTVLRGCLQPWGLKRNRKLVKSVRTIAEYRGRCKPIFPKP